VWARSYRRGPRRSQWAVPREHAVRHRDTDLVGVRPGHTTGPYRGLHLQPLRHSLHRRRLHLVRELGLSRVVGADADHGQGGGAAIALVRGAEVEDLAVALGAQHGPLRVDADVNDVPAVDLPEVVREVVRRAAGEVAVPERAEAGRVAARALVAFDGVARAVGGAAVLGVLAREPDGAEPLGGSVGNSALRTGGTPACDPRRRRRWRKRSRRRRSGAPRRTAKRRKKITGHIIGEQESTTINNRLMMDRSVSPRRQEMRAGCGTARI
jgi:hypothetical protein